MKESRKWLTGPRVMTFLKVMEQTGNVQLGCRKSGIPLSYVQDLENMPWVKPELFAAFDTEVEPLGLRQQIERTCIATIRRAAKTDLAAKEWLTTRGIPL